MFKIIREPEKHFLEHVLSSMIMNSYLNHQLFITTIITCFQPRNVWP